MTPTLGPWQGAEVADLYAPGAAWIRLWSDRTVAGLVWPDGGWAVWLPGVRAALGEAEASGAHSLSRRARALAEAALRDIIARQQQNPPKETPHERP